MPRTRQWLHAVLLAAVLSTMATPLRGQTAPAGERPTKNVLVVYTSFSGLAPFDDFDARLVRSLRADPSVYVEIYPEFVDLTRFGGPGYLETLATYLGAKYAGIHFDLLIAVTGPSIAFLATVRDRLFPGTPLVYGVADDRFLRRLPPIANATGVKTTFDVPGTVELALQIHPGTRRIAYALGSTNLEQIWKQMLHDGLRTHGDQIELIDLSDLPMERLVERVATLPADTILIWTSFWRDSAGHYYAPGTGLARVRRATSVPIYGIFDHDLGKGLLGGRIVDVAGAGDLTGELALRVLHGEDPNRIPPVDAARNIPTFDWRELRAWKIDERRLPAGSIVLFREPSVWELYRWYVLGTAAVIVAQAMLIAGLVAQRSRRRRAELEAEHRRRELAHVSRVSTLGELAASLAHELNQPLTGVLTNAQAAIRFLAADPPNIREVREILDDIVEDDKRAGEVIRRLRAMLQTGKIDPVEIDVNRAVAEVQRLVASDAIIRGVTIDLALTPDLPLVLGDRIQLQQVVLNLVVNGMDAMEATAPGERRLSLRTDLTDRRGVRIAVTDRGTGIAPEKLTRIFEPFVTTKSEGLGMGLSIARTIVEAHGGTLSATNNEDRGATFVVGLPSVAGGRDQGPGVRGQPERID